MKVGNIQTLSGPMVYRESGGKPHIVDDDARRFRFSLSSEEPYVRSSWFDDPWVEVLGHKADEIDLSRFNTGSAPLLIGHNRYGLSSLVGVIERAWLEDGRLMCEAKLSQRDDVADLWRDIKDGIVGNTSAGYTILERTLVKVNKNGPDEYRVNRWRPAEGSLVSVPADSTVGVGRSDNPSQEHYTITDKIEERTMPDKATPAKPAKKAAASDDVVDESQRADDNTAPSKAQALKAEPVIDTEGEKRGAEAERTRASEITSMVDRVGLKREFADELIKGGKPIDEVRQLVIDKVAENGPKNRGAGIEMVKDQVDKHREAAEQWLECRTGVKDDAGKLIQVDGDNPFRGAKLLDLARESLIRAGDNPVGLFGSELAQRAISHSTADFSVILENVMHKNMIGAFNMAGDSWRGFCAVGDLSDFRPHNRYLMGSFSDLRVRDENGEFVDGTLDDARKESITAESKGRILGLTREMLVNDDMGVFTGASRQMGRAAARTLEQDVYALLALNSGLGPVMSDTKTLFHADHGNVHTGVPSAAGFAAAIEVLKTQILPNADTGAVEYLDLQNVPTFLGPIGLAQDAKVINEAQYDPDTANKLQKPNKARGLIGMAIGTPRLSSTPWYLIGDPNEVPVFEVGFLNGVQTPMLESQESFRQHGIQWRVVYEYGIAAVNWLGALRSTGA